MLLDDANRACPGLNLTPSDVVGRQWGRLPVKAGREPGRPDALADRPVVWDPSAHGVANLLCVEGVKLTTARAVAEQVVNQVVATLGMAPRPCRTTLEPLLDAGRAEAGRGTA